ELYTHKEELGFLSMENFFGLRTTVMIQYWRSMDDLLTYARGKKHLTAWRDFNRKVGDNKAVGIYHESYQVKRENYESVFANMYFHGLSKILTLYPITNDLKCAKTRMMALPVRFKQSDVKIEI